MIPDYCLLTIVFPCVFPECDFPRGVPPEVPLVHSVRDLQLLPHACARACVQPLQPDHRVWTSASCHRHLLHPDSVGDDQEDEGEQRSAKLFM